MNAGLYRLKAWFTGVLSPLIERAVRRGISPDAFTLLGVLGGAFAGFGIATLHTWWVFVGVVIRLAGANLDGAVARAANRKSRYGFWLNEVGDRVADWAIFAGLWFIPAGPSWQVWISLMIAISLPTAVSIWGVWQGVARINGGPFGKTERCLFAVVFVALTQYGHIDHTAQSYLLQVLIWLSIVTALIRWQKIGAKR